MTDTRLRELERRWKETGSASDEAEWLRERVRVGDMSSERLELAAHCGHVAACLATDLGPGVSLGECSVDDVAAWAQSLAARGPAFWTAALCAMAEVGVREYARRWPKDSRPRDALAQARQWLAGGPQVRLVALGEIVSALEEPRLEPLSAIDRWALESVLWAATAPGCSALAAADRLAAHVVQAKRIGVDANRIQLVLASDALDGRQAWPPRTTATRA